MTFNFNNGDYKGKSIERVAITDYGHLCSWLKRGINSPIWKTRVEETLRKLDKFVPVVKCCIPGCEKPGYYLSIVRKNDGYVNNISISASFTVCSKEHFEQIPGRAEDAVLYRTTFRLIENNNHEFYYPKSIRKEVSETLCEMAGIPKGVKQEKLEEIINNLKQIDEVKQMPMITQLEHKMIQLDIFSDKK